MKLNFSNHVVAGALIAYGLFFAQVGVLALVLMVRDGVALNPILVGLLCIYLGVRWIIQGVTLPIEEKDEFGFTDAELIAKAESIYGHSVNL